VSPERIGIYEIGFDWLCFYSAFGGVFRRMSLLDNMLHRFYAFLSLRCFSHETATFERFLITFERFCAENDPILQVADWA